MSQRISNIRSTNSEKENASPTQTATATRGSASALHTQQFGDTFPRAESHGMFLSRDETPRPAQQQPAPSPANPTTHPANSVSAPLLEVSIPSDSRYVALPPPREATNYGLAFRFLPEGYSMLPPGAVLPTLNGRLGRASQDPVPAPQTQNQPSPVDDGYVYPSLAHVPMFGGVPTYERLEDVPKDGELAEFKRR